MNKELYLKWVRMLFRWHDKLEGIADVLDINDIYETGLGDCFDEALRIFQEIYDLSDYDMDVFYDMLWDPDHITHVTVIDEESKMADKLTVDIDEFYTICIDKGRLN